MSTAMDAIGIPEQHKFLFKDFLTRAAEEPQLACKQTPELFWSYKQDEVADAKKLCNKCPLKAMCLMYALDAREKDGVWGGTDEAERNTILGRRSRAAKAQRARERRAAEAAKAEAERAELAPALF